MTPAYSSAGHNWVLAERTEVVMAHAKDKGDKQVKKTAQKSIKEKRAAKKAKHRRARLRQSRGERRYS